MHTYERDGLTFDVRDGGPVDGEIIVLLHGFPQDSSSWRRVEPLLHEAGFRTLAPDQRGYSAGAAPTDVAAYDMGELVKDAIALVDAAGADRVHVVGHDWGGGVAWALATSHPERVTSLTILSTPHQAALSTALRTPAQLRKSWYIGAFQIRRVPELVLAGRVGMLLRHENVPDPEQYGRRFRTPRSLRGPINWYRANRKIGASSLTGPVTVPTTYVWGNEDLALGRTAAELTRKYIRGDYRFVELDAGHWLPDNEPERVAAEIVGRAAAQA